MHLNHTKDISVYRLPNVIFLCLRCLRLVSHCWNAFIDDSVYEAQIKKLTCKMPSAGEIDVAPRQWLILAPEKLGDVVVHVDPFPGTGTAAAAERGAVGAARTGMGQQI